MFPVKPMLAQKSGKRRGATGDDGHGGKLGLHADFQTDHAHNVPPWPPLAQATRSSGAGAQPEGWGGCSAVTQTGP